MVASIGCVMHELSVLLGVGACCLILNWLFREVGVARFKIWRFFIKDPHKGMPLRAIEEASWFEVMSANPAPGLQIGQPAYGPVRCVDDIKLSCCVNNSGTVVDLCTHK